MKNAGEEQDKKFCEEEGIKKHFNIVSEPDRITSGIKPKHGIFLPNDKLQEQ